MRELINVFSWSVSAMRDFDECRRKRYWGKYAMWHGWRGDAPNVAKTAYRLTKMENRFTLLGNAVENAVMWMIRLSQHGESADSERVYDEVVKPFLNKRWLESRKGMWKENPKKFCCLHEHYYRESYNVEECEMIARVADAAKRCVVNFINVVLPGLRAVDGRMEIPVATMDNGVPESMDMDGVKVYAIPDYVYRKDDAIHIHDWKAGSPKPFHNEQIALYGLWANVKHGGEPGRIHAHLQYLLFGEVVNAELTNVELDRVRDLITRSKDEMSDYLVNRDTAKNIPLPKDDWEMTADAGSCRRCNFYELCKPELDA